MLPPELLRMVGEDRIRRRIFLLEHKFAQMHSKWRDIYLSVEILRHCVESYFCDIERMKLFHGINLADEHKRAGFTALWIIRAKPIQIVPAARVTKALLLANEYYAIHTALNFLNIEIDNISEDYLLNLFYTLHNRPTSGEVLASMMYLLEKAARRETP